jgi:hypothetical protein
VALNREQRGERSGAQHHFDDHRSLFLHDDRAVLALRDSVRSRLGLLLAGEVLRDAVAVIDTPDVVFLVDPGPAAAQSQAPVLLALRAR